MVPDQVGMGGSKVAATEVADPEASLDKESAFASEAPRASHLATAGYLAIAAGHGAALSVQWNSTKSGGEFYTWLALVQVVLSFEAFVYAAGDLAWLNKNLRTLGLLALEICGRVRLLVMAVAWIWLCPWAAELSCRCGAVSRDTGSKLSRHAVGLSIFTTGWFALRELSFLVRGEPPSAVSAGVNPQFGDCLPSNALLGGQFRLSKSDLEATGRVIFVPARPRTGLYIGSGLAMLTHLAAGISFAFRNGMPPWWLLGAVGALLGRRFGELTGGRKGRRAKSEDDEQESKDSLEDQATMPWRLDRILLSTRLGELFWVWCCLAELQRCEAMPGWLDVCEVGA